MRLAGRPYDQTYGSQLGTEDAKGQSAGSLPEIGLVQGHKTDEA
ncbi:hypothetical protein [Panacagrimonas sp.]